MTKFKRGDAVEAKDKARHPFWMTVTSATGTHVYCRFGSKGGYAGAFKANEVQQYTGPI